MSNSPSRPLAAAVLALVTSLGAQSAQESDYYTLESYTVPDGEIIEVGGIAFLGEVMLVSTRRGQVWWIENALEDDPGAAEWTLFAEGLHEGLGLGVHDDTIYIVQRGELSTLHDLDGDKRCDEVRTLTNAWGMSGNYHEFAFGLPRDPDGNLYIGTNLGFFTPDWWLGKSEAKWRGWILQYTPDGELRPFACGARSPCGLGTNLDGDLFYTDNQGDWMAACPIFHVAEGDYFGHPASLRWTAEFGNGARHPSVVEPAARKRKAAAIWLPYAWSRSAGNLETDRTSGAFGPFGGQQFMAELTNGMVLRTQFEKVRGEYQGAVFEFRRNLGSACRLAFAPDHSMIVGYTNRGWGGRAPGHGLARIRWTGVTPFEMHDVALQQEGFDVRFTEPVDPESLTNDSVQAELYNYSYWWEYGSPAQDLTPLRVRSVEAGSTPEVVRIRFEGLEPARCAKIVVRGIRSASGAPLLHNTFHYTINQLPEGPLTDLYVNRDVPQPKQRRGRDDGWLHMTWGDATGMWKADGWELVDAEVDAEDKSKLLTRPGNGALVFTGQGNGRFESRADLRDFEFRFRFMLPEGGRGEARFMDRYVLELVDDARALCSVRGAAGPEAESNAYLGPGVWHVVSGKFFAPRFGADGEKVEDARFEEIAIENVQVLPRASVPDAEGRPEVANAALCFRSEDRSLCLADIRIRPLNTNRVSAPKGTIDLLASGASLSEWSATSPDDLARWKSSDGVLRGEGGASRLISTASDFDAVEIVARLAVAKGDAGLHFGWTESQGGFEVDAEGLPNPKTQSGSLVGLQDIQTDLVPAGVLGEYRIRCVPTPDGSGREITVTLNGLEIVRTTVDAPRRGHIMLEIDDDTELRVEELTVRRL